MRKGTGKSPAREQFISLAKDLQDCFDLPFSRLPKRLQQRARQGLSPLTWDGLSAHQRREAALQADYRVNPAFAEERKFAWERSAQLVELKREIDGLAKAPARSPAEVASKKDKLRELEAELERQNKLLETLPTIRADADAPRGPFIPYPRALPDLKARIKATPHDIAAWIWLGTKQGGLSAYENANELDPPPRFNFGALSTDSGKNFDFLPALARCWFREGEIAAFAPTDHFISGAELIKQWEGRCGGLPPL